MPKRLNPNLVKIHRNYEISEVAELFCIHKNTVRSWIKNGLPVCDDKRPILIIGKYLKEFIQQKNSSQKQSCKLNEIYCLKCKSPHVPAENMVDYQPNNSSNGRLFGLCPVCESVINKYINSSQLRQIRKHLDVTLPKA